MEGIKRKPFRKTLLGNMLILVGILVLIYWIFFGSLSLITKHNDVRTVPDLVGLNVDSAYNILNKAGFEIKVDSVFDRTRGLHEVVDQQPEKGAKVKSGRIIFLTVNKSDAPMVTLPSFVGKSYRTLESEIKKLNLIVKDTTMVYHLNAGNIISAKINGVEVKPGSKVPEGTELELIISKGLGETKVAIPELVGLTLSDALQALKEKELNYTLRVDGDISDSATALIYRQTPESRSDYGDVQRVYVGDVIDISYMQSPEIEKKVYLKRDNYDDFNDSADTDHTGGSENTTNNRPGTTDPSRNPAGGGQDRNAPKSNTRPSTKNNAEGQQTQQGTANDGSETQKKKRPQR